MKKQPEGIPFDVQYFEKLSQEGINKSIKEVFTIIHQTNHWQGDSSASGVGSDNKQTAVIRQVLPDIIASFHIDTMLDLPCGDFNWMQHVALPIKKYIGADIVEELIQTNQARYASAQRQFRILDLTRDELPAANLLFCRDCLVHLSFEDIAKIFHNLKNSSIQYLLTTTFPTRTENKDIRTGDWRVLNLQAAPFHLPEPLLLINEQCTEGNGWYADKSMGLWKVEDLNIL
jgi:2-polyprenyl-3-methyl-5-hydroxy-6-metoxy-1,4-benzoquinol methylase